MTIFNHPHTHPYVHPFAFLVVAIHHLLSSLTTSFPVTHAVLHTHNCLSPVICLEYPHSNTAFSSSPLVTFRSGFSVMYSIPIHLHHTPLSALIYHNFLT
ncbi:hypothetical protein BKA82DRAFT_371413 [Pisolithus tinctorius]|uniref:Uncharacterized protein n=1 Tax=Pisolithus tinctorius Marx 270 TaxID=870435 RepID=A0A0C3N104_PISTI|nr:hypothetical protein BKA82DRAFT_371413 [Pisolithus tinctorius]KIN94784.1 hypothetical protein M404DRAFT_371413 [Pisolithus tinctorius Marx 270]